MKEKLLKTLLSFNILDLQTRKDTFRSILRYIDVFNAVFENSTAFFNVETLTIEFETIK